MPLLRLRLVGRNERLASAFFRLVLKLSGRPGASAGISRLALATADRGAL